MKAKKQNDLIDIEKLIMALMVAAIHIVPLSKYNEFLYPWLRIAVPFFFLCSSYFLFYKIEKCKIIIEKNNVLKKFIVRNLRLYLSWSIVLFPLIAFMNRDVKGIDFVIKMLKSLFFSGIFGGSWYIIALIEGICIVWIFNKNKKLKIFINLLGCLCYFLTAFSTNYSLLFDNRFIGLMQNNGFVPGYLSVIAGLPWILVGQKLAETRISDIITNKVLISGAVVGAILLYLEYVLLAQVRSPINDGYIMLIAIVPFVFLIGIKSNYHIKYAKIFRELSTIIFCLHHTLNRALDFIFSKTNIAIFKGVTGGLVRYSMVIVVCLIALKGLKMLSNKYPFAKYMI